MMVDLPFTAETPPTMAGSNGGLLSAIAAAREICNATSPPLTRDHFVKRGVAILCQLDD